MTENEFIIFALYQVYHWGSLRFAITSWKRMSQGFRILLFKTEQHNKNDGWLQTEGCSGFYGHSW